MSGVLQWCLSPVDKCWNWAMKMINRVLTCPNSRRHPPPPPPPPQAQPPVIAPMGALYGHTLQTISAFLPLAELHSLVHVSKSWLAALNTIGATQIGPNRHDQHRSPLPAHPTALTRHISSLVDCQLFVSLQAMQHWATKLSNLRELSMLVPHDGNAAWAFPPHLTELNVTETILGERTNNLLRAVVKQLPHLQQFRLSFSRTLTQNRKVIDVINFALLHPAPKLKRFSVAFPEVDTVYSNGRGVGGMLATKQQVDDLRALPHQEILPCSAAAGVHGNRNLALRLLQHPGQPTWTSIGRWDELLTLGADLCDPLRTLTSLTELSVVYELQGAEHRTFLTQLANLKKLQLVDTTGIPGALLLASLQKMHGLEWLELQCGEGDDPLDSSFDSSRMAQLLPHLPRLEYLSLQGFPRIHSLHFLAPPADPLGAPSFADTLTRLKIAGWINHEPQHLRGLKALTHLYIHCAAPTADQLLAWRRLRPRSQDKLGGDIPRLVEFQLLVGAARLAAFAAVLNPLDDA